MLAAIPETDMKSAIALMTSIQTLCFCLDYICEKQEICDENLVNLHYKPLYNAFDLEHPMDNYVEVFGNNTGAYISFKVTQIRKSLALLPSYAYVSGKIKKHLQMYIGVQAFKNSNFKQRKDKLINWSDYYIKQFPDLLFNEFSAAADSFVWIYAALHYATYTSITGDSVKALEEVYVPWISALQKLLQQYISAREDILMNRMNFTDFYTNLKHCEKRLIFMLAKSLESCSTLNDPGYHIALVKFLPAIYLADSGSQFGLNRLASKNLLSAAPYETSLLRFCCKLLGI